MTHFLRKIIKFGFLAVTIFSIVQCDFFGSCTSTLIKKIEAPTGDGDVSIYREGCGVTTRAGTKIVLSIQDSESHSILDVEGEEPINVSWNQSIITIKHLFPQSAIHRYVALTNGVQIKLVPPYKFD